MIKYLKTILSNTLPTADSNDIGLQLAINDLDKNVKRKNSTCKHVCKQETAKIVMSKQYIKIMPTIMNFQKDI